REGDGSIGAEDAEGAGEEPEGHFRDLPQHGRYQGGRASGTRRHGHAREVAVDVIEEDPAGEEAEERRTDPDEDPTQTWQAARRERLLRGLGAVGQRERQDGQEHERRDEGERFQTTADEAATPRDSEYERERAVDRAEDRASGEDRADDADAQRHSATLDEVPRDARLLSGGRWVKVPQELHELALRTVGAVDEAEDADDEGEDRNEREEQLVRDAAGEERAAIVEERCRRGARVACRALERG